MEAEKNSNGGRVEFKWRQRRIQMEAEKNSNGGCKRD